MASAVLDAPCPLHAEAYVGGGFGGGVAAQLSDLTLKQWLAEYHRLKKLNAELVRGRKPARAKHSAK